MVDNNQSGPKANLGDLFARLKTPGDGEQPPVSKSEVSEVWSQVKQNLELKNLEMAYKIANSGGGEAGPSGPDPIDQIAKLSNTFGPNYLELLKLSQQSTEKAEAARTVAEQREASMKQALFDTAIANVRAESQSIIKRIEEIATKKDAQSIDPFQQALSQMAQIEKFKETIGMSRPAAQTDPFQQALSTMAQIEQFKEAVGLSRPAPQERVPLSENPEYHRMLLEDKRLALKDQQTLEIEKKKADTLSNFIAMLPGALSDAAKAYGARNSSDGEQPSPARSKMPAPQQAAATEYIPITCPNPACTKTIPWPKEAQAGAVGECPYCHMRVQNDGDGEEKTA